MVQIGSFIAQMQPYHSSGGDLDALCRETSYNHNLYPSPSGTTRIFIAAEYGFCSDVSWLLERGADVNRGDPKSGKTPLHVAAGYAKHTMPVLLLDAGARVNEQDQSGATPLHNAAY